MMSEIERGGGGKDCYRNSVLLGEMKRGGQDAILLIHFFEEAAKVSLLQDKKEGKERRK